VKIMIFGVSFIFCVTLGELTSQCLNSCFCKMWIVGIFNLILEIFELFLKYLEKFQTIVNSRYRKKTKNKSVLSYYCSNLTYVCGKEVLCHLIEGRDPGSPCGS
jgi:hypothetical protein